MCVTSVMGYGPMLRQVSGAWSQVTVGGNVTGTWSRPGVYYIAQMLQLSDDKIYIDDKLTGKDYFIQKKVRVSYYLILTRFYWLQYQLE